MRIREHLDRLNKLFKSSELAKPTVAFSSSNKGKGTQVEVRKGITIKVVSPLPPSEIDDAQAQEAVIDATIALLHELQAWFFDAQGRCPLCWHQMVREDGLVGPDGEPLAEWRCGGCGWLPGKIETEPVNGKAVKL